MKANINGTVQDYKPRPISKGLLTDDIEINGVTLTPFDLKVFNAASIVSKLKKCEVEYIDTDVYRLMGLDETTENFERLEASISKLVEAELLTIENVFSWGEKEDHAQADEMPDGFTFIGTRSIEEQPDGRGVIDLGSTDDLNTLTDCLDYIERRGDDEAERDKAIVKARELLESFYSNINEAEMFLQESETWIEAIRDDLGNVNPNQPF